MPRPGTLETSVSRGRVVRDQQKRTRYDTRKSDWGSEQDIRPAWLQYCGRRWWEIEMHDQIQALTSLAQLRTHSRRPRHWPATMTSNRNRGNSFSLVRACFCYTRLITTFGSALHLQPMTRDDWNEDGMGDQDSTTTARETWVCDRGRKVRPSTESSHCVPDWPTRANFIEPLFLNP